MPGMTTSVNRRSTCSRSSSASASSAERGAEHLAAELGEQALGERRAPGHCPRRAAPAGPAAARPAVAPRRARPPTLIGARQDDAEPRAFARRGDDLGPAAGLGGEAVDLGKAEAGPLADRLGGEEGLEGARRHLGRHPLAGVRDRDRDLVRSPAGCASTRVSRPPLRHRVAGVDRGVEQGGLELGRHRPRRATDRGARSSSTS